jgi:hypothetical protein
VSPIGRNCSQEERDEFEKYDKVKSYNKNKKKILVGAKEYHSST